MQIRPRRQLIRTLLSVFVACAALAAQAEQGLRVMSNVIWAQNDAWFGGFSGIEISNDGATMTVVSDKGRIVRAKMLRDTSGTLSAIQVTSSVAMTDPSGRFLKGNHTDAEGLAQDAQGSLFVSFEHKHRVMRINPATGRTAPLPQSPDYNLFGPNAGLEALAVHPDGRLFALPEAADRAGFFPVYALDGESWRIVARIRKRGPFLPVGADFDRDGRLYLLERTVTPLGFRSRIRRFDLDAAALGELTLFSTTPARFDNLESLSVWTDPHGKTRLTAISDDNFLPIQRTQIVEFTLTE